MERNARVVVFPPMGRAYSTFIEGGLESMQRIVGGPIDCVVSDIGEPSSPERGIDLWCNDEFLYSEGMSFNRVVPRGEARVPIFGPMFACAFTPEDGESRGLTEDEALSILADERVASPHLVMPPRTPDGPVRVASMRGMPRYEICAALIDLSEEAKLANRIPLDAPSIAEMLSRSLEGRPEAIMIDGSLVRIDYDDPGGEPVVGIYNDPEPGCWADGPDRTLPLSWADAGALLWSVGSFDFVMPNTEFADADVFLDDVRDAIEKGDRGGSGTAPVKGLDALEAECSAPGCADGPRDRDGVRGEER